MNIPMPATGPKPKTPTKDVISFNATAAACARAAPGEVAEALLEASLGLQAPEPRYLQSGLSYLWLVGGENGSNGSYN